jgi:hypothetical protein
VVVPCALALTLLLGAGLVGYRGSRAADHLGAAARLFAQLKQQVEAGDAEAARQTLVALRRETRAARDETSGPSWSVATWLPKAGDDLAAARTVAAALDDLAGKALPPLIAAADGLEAAVLAPRGGAVDLAALRRAAPDLTRSAKVLRSVRERVAAIPTRGLDPRLGTAIPELLRALDRAEQLAGPAERAMRLLPSLLGADSPRTYLLMFQNLAEVRATGGMPGAFIVIEADKGAIRLVDQGTAATTLRTFATPVLPLDPDMVDVHTDRLGTFSADVNLTPDFPTAATLTREMYRVRTGRAVDGVLATDPVALAYLLRATGPIPVPGDAPLNAETAVRRLLNDVYLTIPSPEQQDVYFAGVAKAVFQALLGQLGEPRAVVGALARAAGERRLLVWSAHPDEQRELEQTILAGALPTDDGTEPTVGVFLNDGSGAKLGYYLSRTATLAVGDCLEENVRELRLRVTLGSTAPRSGLPKSVTGLALSGDPHTVRTNVLVFSPTGGGVVDAMMDGAEVEVGTGVERDRAVSVVTVDLPPGVTKTLDFTLLTGSLPQGAGPASARLITTPAVTPWATAVTPGRACGGK